MSKGRLSWFVLAAACLSASAAAASERSAIPAPSVEEALPAIAGEVREAHAAAQAEPAAIGPTAHYCMILHAYEQFTAAASCYQRLRELAPDNHKWAYLLGIVHVSRASVDAAIQAFEDTIRLAPDFYAAKLKLAQLHASRGDIERERAVYEDLDTNHGDVAEVQAALGRWLLALEPERAATILEQAVAQDPYLAQAHYALAMASRRTGDIEKAARHLTLHERYRTVPPVADPVLAEVLQRDRSLKRRVDAAADLVANGDLSRAIAEYDAILSIDPSHPSTLTNMITTHARAGNVDAAEGFYRRSLQAKPDWAQAHYTWGRALVEAGNAEAAIEPLQRAATADRFHDNAEYLLGVAHETTGDHDIAIEHYRRAVAIAPGNRAAHLNLAMQLWRAQNDASAYHFARVVDATDAQTPLFHESIAQFYLENDAQELALEHFERGARSAREQGIMGVAERIERQRNQALGFR